MEDRYHECIDCGGEFSCDNPVDPYCCCCSRLCQSCQGCHCCGEDSFCERYDEGEG